MPKKAKSQEPKDCLTLGQDRLHIKGHSTGKRCTTQSPVNKFQLLKSRLNVIPLKFLKIFLICGLIVCR